MAHVVAALLLAALGTASGGGPSVDATVERDASVAVEPSPASQGDGPRDPFADPSASSRTATPPPPLPPPPRASNRGEAGPTHARATVHAPLRDPFEGPPAPDARPISSDLKDPFLEIQNSRVAPQRPIRDLLDPFEPRVDGPRPGECVTPAGVPVQRPKSMRAAPKRCTPHDPPLLNPFALPA